MVLVIRIFYSLIIGYFFVGIFAFFMQRRLLYYPSSKSASREFLKESKLEFWPDADKTFRGYVDANDKKHTAGLVIVLHGNAGSAWYRDFYCDALTPMGYRVLLVEYPGYAGRPGKRSEQSLVADAKETLQMAFKQYGGPVYLCGESMGCGVAARLAADAAVPVQGLVLITPWDTLPSLAQSIYWFLPAKWLIWDKYDNIRNLKNFQGRVALAIAENDEIIPERHSLQLYNALAGEKRLWTIKNAKHNTWPQFVEMNWWQHIMAFLQKGD
jgi:pimeloyl-ACP methyl ester carboxylesterase